MDGKIDKVREALNRLSGFTYHAADSQDADDIKTVCAALSAIDPDAIRRECARAARNAIFDFGIGNKASNYYSPIIRKELAVQLAERAILGAEPAQDDGKPESSIFPLQNGNEGDWIIDFDFLMAIQKEFRDAEDYGKPSLEEIEEILLTLMRLSEAKRRIKEAKK